MFGYLIVVRENNSWKEPVIVNCRGFLRAIYGSALLLQTATRYKKPQIILHPGATLIIMLMNTATIQSNNIHIEEIVQTGWPSRAREWNRPRWNHLGMIYDQHHKFSTRTKKINPAIYTMVQLKKGEVNLHNLAPFYRSHTPSIFSYTAPCWHPNISNTDKKQAREIASPLSMHQITTCIWSARLREDYD